jgi:hypothetical protein
VYKRENLLSTGTDKPRKAIGLIGPGFAQAAG